VLQWPDSAGSHSLQAAEGEEAPTLATASPHWNGHAAVSFDGVDDHLDGKLLLLELGGGNPSVTFVVAARASDVSISRSVLIWGDPSGDTGGLNLIFTPASGWRFGSFGPQENYTAPAPGTQSVLPALIAGTKSGDNYHAYVDGKDIGSALAAPPIEQVLDVFSVGGAVCSSACPAVWRGEVAELAAYTALSDSTRLQAEACMNERYALSPPDGG
jgi:hypothetical protein